MKFTDDIILKYPGAFSAPAIKWYFTMIITFLRSGADFCWHGGERLQIFFNILNSNINNLLKCKEKSGGT